MMSKKLIRPTDAEDAQITAAALTDPDNPPLTDKELLLDQISRYLKCEFLELPTNLQERVSQAGMGEKMNEGCKVETFPPCITVSQAGIGEKIEETLDGIEEYDWVHIEAENKYLEGEEAKEIEEGEGIRKGKGIRSKIKTERYYIWDKLSSLQREYKVALYDFHHYPGHREKAASEKLVETITPYLQLEFSDLPQPVKMNIAYADDFQLWNKISIEQREHLATLFDIRMLPDSDPRPLIGFYEIREEWNKFAKKNTLLAIEAIPLMNGLDPELWKEYKKNKKDFPKDMIHSIERCLEIAEAEEKHIATPSEWLAWGCIHDLDKPTIKSHEWLDDPNVCMWEFFKDAVNRHVEETNKSRDSHNEQESSQAEALKIKGIDKREIMVAFQGIKWDYNHWGKNLATPPKWLEACRVSKGSKKTSALWNPVCIGLCLLDKEESLKKLDPVFFRLTDWNDDWREKTELERD